LVSVSISVNTSTKILGIGIESKNVVSPSTTSPLSIFFQICKVHQHNENGLQVTLVAFWPIFFPTTCYMIVL